MWGYLLDLLFPPRCVSCFRSGPYLCAECVYRLPQAKRPEAPWMFPLYSYAHAPVRKLLWKLKYRGIREIAGIFGPLLYQAALAEIAEEKIWKKTRNVYLVPIPLTPSKERERGYNQAALLAEAMKTEDREGIFSYRPDFLTKTKETESQMSIKSRNKRLSNVAGTFSARDDKTLRGARIILIDDILTTGATLGEARQALLAAGAKTVTALTVAH